MPQALYYPWIDVADEAWLKTSLLYWDSVRTIVPESVEFPYSTTTGAALENAGFLVPVRVDPEMDEILELTEDALEYLDTNLAGQLIAVGTGRGRYIHEGKLSTELRGLLMHRQKFAYEVLHLISKRSKPRGWGEDWFEVDEGFADFYMTLLARRLSERIGASLLTPLVSAERLAIAARLDGQSPRRHWREDDAYGRRRQMPRTLASGLLAQLAIEKVRVDPETDIDVLLRFREEHRDELARFRMKVEELASSVDGDLPLEALRQRISDLHSEKVEPALRSLKRALDAGRIRWLSEGFLKIAFLSVGSSSMLAAAGLDVPTALLAGAGASLVVSAAMYNVDRIDRLEANPFTYLLAVEREFGSA